MHALSAYSDVAGRLAEEAGRECARILEERERSITGDGEGAGEGEGLRDVLRGLSRVVER